MQDSGIVHFFSENVGAIIWGVIILFFIFGGRAKRTKQRDQQDSQRNYQPDEQQGSDQYTPTRGVEYDEYNVKQNDVINNSYEDPLIAFYQEHEERMANNTQQISESQRIIEEQNRIMQEFNKVEERKVQNKAEGQSTMRPRSNDPVRKADSYNVKKRIIPVFSDDPLVNGVIWSEILTPKGKGFSR